MNHELFTRYGGLYWHGFCVCKISLTALAHSSLCEETRVKGVVNGQEKGEGERETNSRPANAFAPASAVSRLL